MWQFYQDTGQRKWGHPYLTRAFFEQVGAAMGEACLLFLALRDERPIAGALNFIGSNTLFGRYWGASEEVEFLHFELSYYRAIEWAIANGLRTVQAGAQGEHKLARGYEPVRTFSVHHFPDLSFRRAVADFLVREREAGVTIFCKAWPVRNGERFSKLAFSLDWAAGTAIAALAKATGTRSSRTWG